MTTYYEKLRDPRWQRRRLEIMNRANFTCEECGSEDKTLNVHHKLYRKGADPWDYTDDELTCICEVCHEEHHHWRTRLDKAMAEGYCRIEALAGYAEGMTLLCNPDRPEFSLKLESFEHAGGVGAAFAIRGQDVIAVADEAGIVNGRVLWDAFRAVWKIEKPDL